MNRLRDIGTISEKYRDLEHEFRRLLKNEYDAYIQKNKILQ